MAWLKEELAMRIQIIFRVPTYPSKVSNSNLNGHAGAALVGSGQVVAQPGDVTGE